MSIEPLAEIQLDKVEQGELAENIKQLEAEDTAVVTLNASVDDFDRILSALMTFRSANISTILLIHKSDDPNDPIEDEEIQAIFTFLRNWDQLLLHNVLELCGDWVPQTFITALEAEAKSELKWFREWWTAYSDQRIHKYPILPWRRFVRKVVQENYQFAIRFLDLVAKPATPENIQEVQKHFQTFLENKRKVLSIFPKKWSRLN